MPDTTSSRRQKKLRLRLPQSNASMILSSTIKFGTSLLNLRTVITLMLSLLISMAHAQTTTYSIFSPTSVPATTDPETRAIEVGVKFRTTVNGFITGIRYYKAANNTGTHIGTLWSRTGTMLARATFIGETASGWQQVLFSSPVAVTAGTTYVASYHTNTGRYSINTNYFTANTGATTFVQALRSGLDGANGVYRYSANSIFPNSGFRSSNYWVDVLFSTTTAPDQTPPTVTANTPLNGATNVSISSTITATFNEAIDPATLNSTTFEVRNAANTLISGTISYNATTRVVTFTPAASLANSTVYTATLKGGATDPLVKDAAGNALAADHVWSFTTVAGTALTVTSNTPASGATGIALTTTITATFNQAIDQTTLNSSTFELRDAASNVIPGTITYNTTTRTATLTPSAALTGSTVYTATVRGGATDPRVKTAGGMTLATDRVWSFTTVTPTPLTITTTTPTSGATGIAITTTVRATFSQAINTATLNSTTFELRDAANNLIPSTITYNGNNRIATLTPSAPLANSTVYTATVKGGATDPRVKTTAGVALTSDYVWSFTTIPLTVSANTPANAATNVAITSTVTGTFNQAIDQTTLNTSTFELRDAANTLVPANITYNTTTRVATLTPAAALANSTVYTATIKGGASDPRVKTTAGISLASDFTWSFTTVAATPLAVTANTPANSATNVAITSTVTGTFNQDIDQTTLNSSTFELRDAANTLVTATISYNTTTRVATLTPAAALANSTVYTATIKGGATDPRVKTPTGIALAADHTWSFTTVAATPLTVTSNTPANSATNVATNIAVTATFNQAIDQATLDNTTFELRNAANTLIPAGISYNTTTRTATLTPSTTLANSTVYTVTIKGGATDPRVKATNGVSLATDFNWSFTTADPIPAGQYSIFAPTSTPAATADDQAAVELGVKFRSSISGFITGIRFYKSAGNTGTHTGNLWTRTGDNLGRATFINESASGWQQVSFAAPIAITAGTTYVASYHAPDGNYSINSGQFASAVTSGPLTALANSVDVNGIYRYSSSTVFPNSTFNSSNYWVDVVFVTEIPADDIPPQVTARIPANGAAEVNTSTTITVTFNEAIDPATLNSTTFTLEEPDNSVVQGAFNYNASSRTMTFTPSSSLANSTVYTATLRGGTTDPRVKDVAGNALVNNITWSFTTNPAPPPPPTDGPGGPILVVSTSANPFSRYTVEILRAEGLNQFTAMDISAVTAGVLNNYEVVILGEVPLTTSQVGMFSDWTNAGGTFIAFKPDIKLAPLLGITRVSGTRSDQYMLVNTANGPGKGIVNQTIQYHGTSDLYTLNGATSLATLYSSVSTATANPAVTSRDVSNGGQAIAFTYDLPRSIVYTRQGNPAWVGQKRDGAIDPIRSDDLFFPDWVNLDKVAIPQADEHQRLLANIIIQGNLDRKPLPRFWYLPKGLKAAVVMTGDDHANGGTAGRFNQYKSLSSSNTPDAVADWTAIRSTSYIVPGSPLTNSQLSAFQAEGFEIALHLDVGCQEFTASSLNAAWNSQTTEMFIDYPSINPFRSNRTHCMPWNEWATQAKVQAARGVRLDVNYYYWPDTWIQNRPGMFTGSGIPMRFADLDGTLIDCYQVPTQITDESGITNYTTFINALLDKAKGPEGYYGVFCANMHTDAVTSTGSNAIVNSAIARQIPVVSARQMLDWLDGRNNSAFNSLSWSGNELSFSIVTGTGARNLKAMLPTTIPGGQLSLITANGSSITYTVETIKGIEYAFFNATPANYTATYGTTTLAMAEISDFLEMKIQDDSKAVGDQEIKLSVFPNPSSDEATVEFSTPGDESRVVLDIYDGKGINISRIYEGPSQANQVNSFSLGQLNLSPGVYFIRLTTPQKTQSTKIIRN